MRRNLMAVAAVMALGTATIASTAFAAPPGGFGGGGGGGAPHASFGGGGGAPMGGGPHASFGAAPHGNFGTAAAPNGFARSAPGQGNGNFAGPRTNFAGRDFDHDRHGRGFGPGFGVGIYAFGGPAYYDYNDYDYVGDSCWQRVPVPTPYGLRWRLVDVCE
jgi:hypothetical protein